MVFGIRAPETSDPNMGKVYYMTDNTQFNKPSQKVSIFKNPNYGNYNRDHSYRCGTYPQNNNYNQPNSQVNNKLLQIVAMLISILQDMMGAQKPQPPVKPKPQPPVNDGPIMMPLYAGPDINPPNNNIKPFPMPHIDDDNQMVARYAGPDFMPYQ